LRLGKVVGATEVFYDLMQFSGEVNELLLTHILTADSVTDQKAQLPVECHLARYVNAELVAELSHEKSGDLLTFCWAFRANRR
jgi:hypothetical protein